MHNSRTAYGAAQNKQCHFLLPSVLVRNNTRGSSLSRRRNLDCNG